MTPVKFADFTGDRIFTGEVHRAITVVYLLSQVDDPVVEVGELVGALLQGVNSIELLKIFLRFEY